MIIFINGAFGAGKTTTAKLLEQQLENAMIFDPEEVGMMLRAMIPNERKAEHERSGDFQDLDLWRHMTVKLIGEFKAKYNCDLIIPMTLRKPEYFEYIYKGAAQFDEKTYHFCLEAPLEVIHSRLLERGDVANGWSFHQTEKCLEGFKKIKEKIVIENHVATPMEVTEMILGLL